MKETDPGTLGSDVVRTRESAPSAGPSCEPSPCSGPHDRERALCEPNVIALEQGLSILGRLDAERYRAAPIGLAPSGVGRHLRHVYDYYQCFLHGLDSGHLDYDRRERDERFERDPAYAAERLRELIERLGRLPGDLHDRALQVRMDVEPEALASARWCRSTIGRELRFLASHTIHHFALIDLLLRAQGFECGAGFGVAPSTLQHQREAKPCAPSPGSSD